MSAGTVDETLVYYKSLLPALKGLAFEAIGHFNSQIYNVVFVCLHLKIKSTQIHLYLQKNLNLVVVNGKLLFLQSGIWKEILTSLSRKPICGCL